MYLTLEAALLRAKERAGINGNANDAFLTELLQLSAGVTPAPNSVTHYRPYYVAARYLEQNQAAQTLIKADGVEFTGLVRPIASLMALQLAYDSAQGLIVPLGFEIPSAYATRQTFRFPGSRSHVSTIRP